MFLGAAAAAAAVRLPPVVLMPAPTAPLNHPAPRRLPAAISCSTSDFSLPLLRFRFVFSWWRDTVVERRSLAGELSLSCARPAADG